MRAPGVRRIVAAFLVMSISFGVLEVGIPAFADALGSAEQAGILLSLLAVGSLTGALVYGSRQWPGTVDVRYRVLLTAFGVGLVLVPLASGLVSMAGAMFLAGVTLAPSVICAYLLVEAAAPAGSVTEAFSWTTTGNVLGAAAGAAAAGVAVDVSGPRAALMIGTAAVLAAALIAWLTRWAGSSS